MKLACALAKDVSAYLSSVVEPSHDEVVLALINALDRIQKLEDLLEQERRLVAWSGDVAREDF
jgi:hypothetical protein